MPATLEDILGPQGAIARRLGASYEHRPQQLEMAEAVQGAFDSGHHLMVEAGTGVGKSFAYLTPAINYAVKTKKRVVISTHTISLQEQLIEKDIPLIRSVYPDEFTAVLVKGRSNYLCQRRLEQTRGRQNHLFDTQPATKVSTPTEVCRNLVESIPDSLACAVVNLATGLIVASHHVPSYLTQAYLDALAAAAVDMFRGRNVKRIEDMLSKARGTPVKDTFEEITITTAGTHHFMKAIRDRNLLVVMVTKPTPNAVPIWSKLRIAIPEILAAH